MAGWAVEEHASDCWKPVTIENSSEICSWYRAGQMPPAMIFFYSFLVKWELCRISFSQLSLKCLHASAVWRGLATETRTGGQRHTNEPRSSKRLAKTEDLVSWTHGDIFQVVNRSFNDQLFRFSDTVAVMFISSQQLNIIFFLWRPTLKDSVCRVRRCYICNQSTRSNCLCYPNLRVTSWCT